MKDKYQLDQKAADRRNVKFPSIGDTKTVVNLPMPPKKKGRKAFDVFKKRLQENISEFSNIKENVYNRVLCNVMDEFDLWGVKLDDDESMSNRKTQFNQRLRNKTFRNFSFM